MKKNFIIIGLISIVLIGGISLIFIISNSKNKELESSSDNKTLVTKSSNELENVITNNIITTNVDTTKEESENKTTATMKTTTLTNKNKDNGTTTKNSTTRKKETITKEIVTTKKNDRPWERFGVTEDEYYNKPIYKWETVDFSVEKYGSQKNATKACIEYGDKYELYLKGEENYNCDSVYSLSGRYLGEMFYTEKLR